MKVTVAEIRKLRDLVVASANNPKMRGETIVRAFAMANEIYEKDGYALRLFHNLNKSARFVESVIDRNKANRNGNALVYIAAKPGAFIAVDEAYSKMCLRDINNEYGDEVNYLCANGAVSQLIGITLLSPKRDFEFVLSYIMKLASEESGKELISMSYRSEVISEVMKLRKALEKEYNLDGSLCHAAKMGFMETSETNREYLEAISNGRDSSPLSNVGSVSVLATVLLAATTVYLRTVGRTADGFYDRAYALYADANHAATQEYHPWDQAVYTHINVLNKKGAIFTPVGLYVDSLRTRLNDSIKAFLADTTEDTLIRLLTSICFIQQERVTFMTYMDFTNGYKDSDDKFESRVSKYLMQTYFYAVRLTGFGVSGKPRFELFQ